MTTGKQRNFMNINSRLFLYFFSTFFLMFAVISFFQYEREKKFRTEQLDLLLSTYNKTIQNYITVNDWNYDNLMQLIGVFPDSTLRVTIIDLNGNVLFDNTVDKNTILENHIERPEIQLAQTHQTGKAIRFSTTKEKDFYYLAQRFNHYFVRSAMPYNLNLSSMLKANTFFLYFMALILVVAVFALFFISKNFSDSIERLKIFTQNAEKGNIPNVEIKFPRDELGEISNNIVHLYKRMLNANEAVHAEREKLIKHLQISQEGLGIFSSDKKEILANAHFIQSKYFQSLKDFQHLSLLQMIF